MKKFAGFMLCFCLCLSLTTHVNGQLKTEKVALGFSGGGMLGDTDFGRDDKFGIGVTGFFRHAIYGPLEGQLTGMFGELRRDKDNLYRTNLITGDYRLLVRLFSVEAFSPYVFGGGGGLYYEVKTTPPTPTAGLSAKEWTPFATSGGGFQIKLVSRLSLDVHGGYGLAFSDALNLVEAGSVDDGFFYGAAGLTITGSSADKDSDKDGLTDKDEKRFKTDKKNPDTDGDGLNDGDELYEHRTHPIKQDTDGDGVDDPDEILLYNSNPRKKDTDNDKLTDAEEVFTHKTNPNLKDSDGDKLSDHIEVSVTGTDPNQKDTDGDGLDDGQELTQYKTDAKNSDSDGDGINDGDEILKYNSNPLLTDSDSDNLTDQEEVSLYKTNPAIADTDSGSVDDGKEVERGTNPLDGSDDKEGILDVGDVGAAVVLDGILFASGRANISPQSIPILDKAYQTLTTYSEMEVEIQGHTDNTGSRSLNMRLSQSRADAVRDYLIRKGIQSYRIITRGYGPDRPVTSNATRSGRALNRRIEFLRTK